MVTGASGGYSAPGSLSLALYAASLSSAQSASSPPLISQSSAGDSTVSEPPATVAPPRISRITLTINMIPQVQRSSAPVTGSGSSGGRAQGTMGLRINHNIAALNTYRNLLVAEGQMSRSLERLSSGRRINQASDDAAGLSVSENLRSRIGGLTVAIRNAQDGIGVVQTSEGALDRSSSILLRMRDLAIQTVSGDFLDGEASIANNAEFQQLKAELDRIGNTTAFGMTKLLDGTYGVHAATLTSDTNAGTYTTVDEDDIVITFAGTASALGSVTVDIGVRPNSTAIDIASHVESRIRSALQAGFRAQADLAENVTVETISQSNGENRLSISIAGLGTGGYFILSDAGIANHDITAYFADPTGSLTSTHQYGEGGTFHIGAGTSVQEQIIVAINDMRANALGLADDDLLSAEHAQTCLDDVDIAMDTVSRTRSSLGALHNRFEHIISHLSFAVESLSSSESRIRDSHMASEMVAFKRSQILTQAGSAMLAQATQAPQHVLELLKT